MKLLIVDNADLRDAWFNEPLAAAIALFADYEMVNYTEIPQDLTAYGGVILSGVPINYSFESIEERGEYATWLLDTALPVLGICGGHQIIGSLFGASILKGEEAENDLVMLRTLADDPVLDSLGTEFEVKALHRGSITVPQDFTLLASSTRCKNQIMKHAYKDIYGVQFHPELSSTGLTIFKNFINLAAKRYNERYERSKPKTMYASRSN